MRQTSPPPVEIPELQDFSFQIWREKFLRLILLGAVILGFFTALLSSLDLLRRGETTLPIIYMTAWGILLIIALLRLPNWVRTGGILFLCWGIALSGLLENGMRGDARIFFLLFILLAVLLINPRAGLIALIISFVTILVIALLVFSGNITLSSKTTPAGDVWLWVVSSISLALVATISLIAVSMLMKEFNFAQTRLKHMLMDLQKSHHSLEQTYDATLEGWSRALELRDPETQDHSQRVVDLTLQLARAAGIPEKEIPDVRRGVLLHDIGKLAVPDEILRKTSELSKSELREVQLHPEYARELLEPITFLRNAMQIPFCHHERWDGSGYPRHLKGKDIPLEARVFAIVDVWDALSHDRPYRKKFPPEEVISYLREQSGKLFDPELVALFVKLLNG